MSTRKLADPLRKKNVQNDIVDFANNLVQHSYTFTVDKSINDRVGSVTVSTVFECVNANSGQ